MLVKKSLKLVTIMSLMLTLSVVQMFAATIGNATIARTFTDTYHNFTIIDTNNSVLDNGEITSFSYYAANTNAFSFVVVSSANVVEYLSPSITPAATGVQTYTPAAPIAVTVGDNIGMYFESTGTIPFDYVGDPSVWTPNNVGPPTVGIALPYEYNLQGRTYSLSATVRVPFDGANRSYGYYKTHGPLPVLPIRTCNAAPVSAFGTPTTFAAAPNTTYTITSSGTFLAGDGIEGDAKYSERNNSGFWTDSVQSYEELGPTLLDLQVSADNGATYSSPDWGSFNASHVYSVNYTTAAGQTQLIFRINDTFPSNNEGSLAVTVCTGVTKFTTQQIRNAFDHYSESAFNKFLTQYAVTLFNLQSNPALANAVYDSDTGSTFDGLTVQQLAALAETYSASTPAAQLNALKDVFDNINNNRFIYLP